MVFLCTQGSLRRRPVVLTVLLKEVVSFIGVDTRVGRRSGGVGLLPRPQCRRQYPGVSGTGLPVRLSGRTSDDTGPNPRSPQCYCPWVSLETDGPE